MSQAGRPHTRHPAGRPHTPPRCMQQTSDRQTSRQHHHHLMPPERGHNKYCLLCKPTESLTTSLPVRQTAWTCIVDAAFTLYQCQLTLHCDVNVYACAASETNTEVFTDQTLFLWPKQHCLSTESERVYCSVHQKTATLINVISVRNIVMYIIYDISPIQGVLTSEG